MLAGSICTSALSAASTRPLWKSTSTYARASSDGGLGIGTAAKPVETRTSRNSGISRDRGISGNSGGQTVRAAIVRQRKSGMSPLLRNEVCVADAKVVQAFHVEVELLGARERADAHAMQRAVVARHLVEAGELDAGGEQLFDAAACILVVGEHASLDEHWSDAGDARGRRIHDCDG